MSVLAPTSELLSFAWPKESNQRKGHPTAAYFLGSKAFVGGWQKGASCPFANPQQKLRCSARQTGKQPLSAYNISD
jgi:hypothetical protein